MTFVYNPYFFRFADADALSRTLGRHALRQAEPAMWRLTARRCAAPGAASARRFMFSRPLRSISGSDRRSGGEPDASEITAALALLKDLPLNGAIVTGDAIFAQRALCRHIGEAGGHYLFTSSPTSRR